MLLKRNLLETMTLLSCSGTVLCILMNYLTDISPITGVWFLIYILALFVLSVFLSIRFIQWLLHLNKPLKYDLGCLEDYPGLAFLRDVLPRDNIKPREGRECAEYDTNELSVISTVLERKLVSSWYVPYVSEEIGFPFACKQLLDQMISKAFQVSPKIFKNMSQQFNIFFVTTAFKYKISHKIETKDVFVDMCAVFITHLKEYKKAMKRHEKLPTSSIHSFYKKTHPIFNSMERKLSSADHCVNILRIILKELVPWELWDTPHSELLIRVLAKKLDNYVDTTLSDPAWLNDRLFIILKTKCENEDTSKESEKQNVESKVEKNDIEDNTVNSEFKCPPETKIFSIPATEIKMPPILPKLFKEESKDIPKKVNPVEEMVGTQPVEIKPTAVLRQRRGRQGRNEVKIYDRIIEGSVKTWETDMDLQCISVGQDLLASLDEMTLSRLWGQEDAEHSPNLRNRSPQPLWFGEEDSIDIDHLEPIEVKEIKKENSPKPTDALLKDIQTTVHQAKSKIGDLQVPLDIDVPCKHSSDEAAGMMEGLLDIGLAGIKKGLRFTGLSDDSQEKSPSHHKDKGGGKVTPPDSARAGHTSSSANELKEGSSHAAHKDEAASPIPQLVKQQRVTSQDSVPSQQIPTRDPPVPLVPLSDSPEPEYEEVADLSTSIARLRSLLQETGNRPQYMFCEGAEETAGRTHLAHHGHASSRPVDTATLADEYDMSGESSSPRQAPNNMQRLDKLFQRTVTGMLNSIKTAVSADEEVLLQPAADWGYIVADSADNSVSGAVGRLLGARRSLWQVDAALDSLQQLPPPPQPQPVPEDWEEWCAGEGARWSGGCEAASAAGLGRQHVAHRLATLLFADLGEALISSWLDELAAWLRAQVFVVFQKMSAQEDPALGRDTLREFCPEETCAMLMAKVPGVYIFGEDAVREAVQLVVSSFSHKPINEDVIYRALDLFAVHFKKSAGLRNPSFDNN